jgi:hypothetical protein
MKLRSFVLALLALVPGCASTLDEDVGGGEDAVTTFATIKPTWKGPAPGSTNNDLDAQGVLEGWRKVEALYTQRQLRTYDSAGRVRTPGADFNYPVGRQEAEMCLQNPVPWWSDLLIHFYCWHPSYEHVTNNVRGCFSYVTRQEQGPPPIAGQPIDPTNQQRMLFYPEVYDYCLFQPYDQVKQEITGAPAPVFDTAEIDKNKQRRNGAGKVGVMKWTDDNMADAFKHVMFTWYQPMTYDMEQQQDVVNAFYGVDLGGKKSYTARDAQQVQACNDKRPLRAGDPQDGTHCSTTKQIQLIPSRNYADALKYMQEQVETQPYQPTRL